MRSTFITVMGWSFLFACLLAIVLIVAKSFQRFRVAREGIVIAKAIAALAVWILLSIGNLIVLTGYAASENFGTEPPLELGTAELSVASALLLYMGCGFGLIYWTSQRFAATFLLALGSIANDVKNLFDKAS